MFSGLLIGTGAWYSKRCALTWKLKVTPYSRLLFQLAPSALRTEGIEFGLLHTPSAQEPGITVDRLVTKEGFPAEIGKRAYDKHTGRLAQVGLTQQVQMMRLLPTPKASDLARGNRDLNEAGQNVNSKGVRFGVALPQLAKSGLLPTPKCQEARGNASIDRGKANLTDAIASAYQPTGKSSQLSPRFVAEMMGFPVNWTELPFQSGATNPSKDMETQSSHK
jgi:hypothetical protein